MTTGLRMTAEQYLALPEEKPYREYTYGEAANEDHGALAFAVIAALVPVVNALGGRAGPEPRVRFATERGYEYRLPDVAYWLPGRPRHEGDSLLPPTLAFEIRSPDETLAEQRERCRYFRRYGVDACWLIDPLGRTVERVDATGDGAAIPAGGAIETPLVPGFRLALADLFAVLEP